MESAYITLLCTVQNGKPAMWPQPSEPLRLQTFLCRSSSWKHQLLEPLLAFSHKLDAHGSSHTCTEQEPATPLHFHVDIGLLCLYFLGYLQVAFHFDEISVCLHLCLFMALSLFNPHCLSHFSFLLKLCVITQCILYEIVDIPGDSSRAFSDPRIWPWNPGPLIRMVEMYVPVYICVLALMRHVIAACSQ